MEKTKRSFFGAMDMTQGSPMKNIIAFSIPLLIGNIAQQLYSTVDSIIVGRAVGDSALAAIGVSMPILFLMMGMFMGLAGGAGIVVSQYFGAKDREKLEITVETTLTMTVICSVAITAIGYIITPPLLRLMNTPEEIFDMARSYLSILFLGMMGIAFYNIVAGILRGLGDSIFPLIYLVVATVINVVLDLVFIYSFDMGVAGAAWATIIAQAISAIGCIIRLLRMKDVITIRPGNLFKPQGEFVKRIIRIGVPNGVTQAIFSMAGLVVQSLTNSFGTEFVAVSTIVMRVDGFAIMPTFTFGMAMMTYAGQNIGAGKLDRVIKGTRDGLMISILVTVGLIGMILLFGPTLMSLFTSTPVIINMAVNMLWLLAVGYVGMAITQTLSGVMRGAGDTVTPMIISIINTIVLRVPIAYTVAYFTRSAEFPNGRPESIFISLLSAWVAGSVLTIIAFKIGKWKEKGVVKAATESGID